MNATKAADLRVPLGPCFNRDIACHQIFDELIEIISPKIDHPCLFAAAEIIGVSENGPRIVTPASWLLKAEIRAQIHLVLVQAWKAQENRNPDRHNSATVDQFLEELNGNPDGQPNCRVLAYAPMIEAAASVSTAALWLSQG